jgi:hypothetical protein
MSIEKFLIAGNIEPLTLSIEQVQQATGESRSQVYVHIRGGTYEAIKNGRRTLVTFESVKRHIASLPPANIKPSSPRARRA